MIPQFFPRQKVRFIATMFMIASVISSGAATVTSTITQHATVTKTGSTADESVARFATYYNSIGYLPSYLVMDFELSASSFGTEPLDDISQATITVRHSGDNYTAGRFDVYYVENSSPSITTGSTEMLFSEMYSYGFNPSAPPSYLSGLTKVSSPFYSTGIADITIDLSIVESSMMAKINAGEKIRFVFTESTQPDNTVSAWLGLGNYPPYAPQLTVTAVPEPAPMALFSGLFLVFSFFRKRREA